MFAKAIPIEKVIFNRPVKKSKFLSGRIARNLLLLYDLFWRWLLLLTEAAHNGDGKTRSGGQGELWVATKDLAAIPGHPFCARLNKLLEKHDFDKMAEDACRPYYVEAVGRPSIPPGVYFRDAHD